MEILKGKKVAQNLLKLIKRLKVKLKDECQNFNMSSRF